MATRNRTLVFIQFRNEKKSFRGGPSSSGYRPEASLLNRKKDEDQDNDIELGGTKYKMSTIPPGWMALIDDVNYDISKIKQQMESLAEHHKNHLLPQFVTDDRVDDEQTIQVLTEYITKMFHDCQSKIQKIGHQAVGPQEDQIKKNIQSALALQLQELSVQFRKAQKDYLQRLRGRQHRGRNLPEDEPTDDDKYDIGFTPEQLKALDTANDVVSQRDKDIKEIVKSITELAAIFKDLSVLVIEQGTILDRIDYNIETVSHNVDEGVKQLGQASNYQKSYRKKLCMLLLCIGILVVLVVLIFKGLLPH